MEKHATALGHCALQVAGSFGQEDAPWLNLLSHVPLSQFDLHFNVVSAK